MGAGPKDSSPIQLSIGNEFTCTQTIGEGVGFGLLNRYKRRYFEDLEKFQRIKHEILEITRFLPFKSCLSF